MNGMEFDPGLFTWEERIGFALRALYRDYGYSLYRMSKFEEYDLYARNKDFLISDNVITFNDAGGRLMALKPDVTLSIVRSTRERGGGVRKLCYNEHVYRVPHQGGGFRELSQAGIEGIGAVGEGEIAETLTLAMKSLERVSGGAEYTLNVSHLGLLSALLDRLDLRGERRQAAVEAVQRRSVHELERLCGGGAEELQRLLYLPADPGEAMDALEELFSQSEDLCRLRRAAEALGERLRLDFSLVSDMHYYNGVIFKGYVSGVPAAVLAGGQYDQLLRRLGRGDRAIGFAVYVDRLERVGEGQA